MVGGIEPEFTSPSSWIGWGPMTVSPGVDSARIGGILSEIRGWIRRRLLAPDSRRFRLILAASGLVQLVLAPLTSWSGDTPAFITAGMALVYNGSPYASNQFFNAPLGPYLSAPLLWFVLLFRTPQALLPQVGSILPAAAATGVSQVVPAWPALLALKVPLIAANLLVGLCIFYLVESSDAKASATLIAAFWVLNPLVIWATAVHGEVDVLGVAGVVVFIVAARQGWTLLAGVAFGLGIMGVTYPWVLIPVSVIAVGALRKGRPPGAFLPSALTFLAGALLALLPFVFYLSTLTSLYTSLYPQSQFGGISVLILFNSVNFPYGQVLAPTIFSSAAGGFIHEVFYVLLVAGLAISVVALSLQLYARPTSPSVDAYRWYLVASLGPAAGILLYQPAPQSENMLLLLFILVLLSSFGSRVLTGLYWAVSGAGLFLYWTLLTPLGFFYPFAVEMGPSWVSRINSIVIAYHANKTFPPHDSWVVAGVIGGTAIVVAWMFSALVLSRELLKLAGGEGSGVQAAGRPGEAR